MMAAVDIEAQVPLHCFTVTGSITHWAPVAGCENVVPPSFTSVSVQGSARGVVGVEPGEGGSVVSWISSARRQTKDGIISFKVSGLLDAGDRLVGPRPSTIQLSNATNYMMKFVGDFLCLLHWLSMCGCLHISSRSCQWDSLGFMSQ